MQTSQDGKPVTEDLFRSGELRVSRVGGFSERCCIVTFDSYTDRRTLERPGFGQHFFQTRGIDAIHVISRDNDWYQHPELREALDAVRAVARGYRRVVAYGSSMGAYAALRFGAWAGADCAVALSPQYSIDPKVVRFERRWAADSVRFRAVWEGMAGFATPGEAYVLYDPTDHDRKHIALLERESRFIKVRLPGAGHPVTGFLMELGLLPRLVMAACDGTVDTAALVAEARDRRAESPQYLMVQASRTWLVSRRVGLLEAAVRVAPHHAVLLSHLGLALGRAGRHDDAVGRHVEALAKEPSQPRLLEQYSHTLQRVGDLAGALRVMEEAWAGAGETEAYLHRMARLRMLLARPAGRRGWRARWRA